MFKIRAQLASLSTYSLFRLPSRRFNLGTLGIRPRFIPHKNQQLQHQHPHQHPYQHQRVANNMSAEMTTTDIATATTTATTTALTTVPAMAPAAATVTEPPKASTDDDDYLTGYKMNDLDPDSDYCKKLPANVRRVLGMRYARQGSMAWLRDRMHIYVVSGTTADDIVKGRTASLTETHMAWKQPFVGNKDTERGKANEGVALKLLSEKLGVRIFELGTVPHPDHWFIGVSPDGITELGDAVEIKCPREICRYIKPQYATQVQMELMALQASKAYFVQYQIPQYAAIPDANGNLICIQDAILDIRIVEPIQGWFEKNLPMFRMYREGLMELRKSDPEWSERHIAWTTYAKNPRGPKPEIVQRFLAKPKPSLRIALVRPENDSPNDVIEFVSVKSRPSQAQASSEKRARLEEMPDSPTSLGYPGDVGPIVQFDEGMIQDLN